MKNIGIILLNYNGTEDTIECIKSIEKLNDNNFNLKVAIVDNNSKESEYLKLETFLSVNKFTDNKKMKYNNKYILIKNNKNIGFAAGNNKAIRYFEEFLDIDYYMLLNNDTILNKDSIHELIKAFSIKNVGAASGLILDYSTKTKIWYAGGYISKARSKGVHENYGKNFKEVVLSNKDTSFLSGCYVIFKREALLNIGLLNERYYFGTEEYDYSLKLKKMKYKLMFMPNSVIYHKVKIAEGNGSSHNIKDLIYIYNSMRNKYILKYCNSSYLTTKLWELQSRFYIKYILYSRLNKNTNFKKEDLYKLYIKYMENNNKKYIDHKEFNEVKEAFQINKNIIKIK